MSTKNPTRKAKKIAELLICQTLQESAETESRKGITKTKNKARISKTRRKLEAQRLQETKVLCDVEIKFETESLLVHSDGNKALNNDDTNKDMLIKLERGEVMDNVEVSINNADPLTFSTEMAIKEEPACELNTFHMGEEANIAIDPLTSILMHEGEKLEDSNKDIQFHGKEVKKQVDAKDNGIEAVDEKQPKSKRKRSKNKAKIDVKKVGNEACTLSYLDDGTCTNNERGGGLTVSAQRQRERRAKESPEEKEARRVRQRILTMKYRLAARIFGNADEKLNEERARNAAKVRLKRKKIREAETSEEAAARKRRQALQLKLSRSRLIATETPEETAARRARERGYNKNYRLKMISNETPEERSARKERERQYREKHKESKLSKEQHSVGQLQPIAAEVNKTKPDIE